MNKFNPGKYSSGQIFYDMKKIILICGLIIFTVLSVWSQPGVGDWRTRNSGAWNGTTVWQQCTSTSPETWTDSSTPPGFGFTTVITIISGHTITSTSFIIGITTGQLVIENGATLTMTNSGHYISVPTVTINGNLSTSGHVTSSTSFTLGATGYFNTAYVGTQGWWSGTSAPSSVTLSGTLEYSSTSDQRIASLSGMQYNNLTVSGNSRKYINSNNLTINGLLTISSGTFDLNNFGITINGTGITNNGTLTDMSAGNSDYINIYSTGQVIQGTGTFGQIYNINIGAIGTFNICDASFTCTNPLTVDYLIIAGSLTLGSQAQLTIATSLQIDFSFGVPVILSSDATYTASLINNGTLTSSVSPEVEVERYQSGSEWHVVSSPVGGYPINTFISDNNIDTSPNAAPTHYAMTHFAAGTDWVTPTYSIASPPTSDMVAGQGYLVGVVTPNELISYTGSFHTSDVTIAVSNTGTGLNCVGNPFSSAMSITADATGSADYFLSSSNTDILDISNVAIWLYDPEAFGDAGGFVMFSSTEGLDYVPVGQGFLIKAQNSGNIELNLDMQTHNNGALFYKKSAKGNDEHSQVYLHINAGDLSTGSKIYFIDNMTPGLDPSWDVAGVGFNPDFRIYSKLLEGNENKFYVQCLPKNDFSTMSIPIGIDFTEGGLITISAEILNLPSECMALLEDRELGVFTDLKETDSKYMVSLDANTSGTGRFYLHTFDPRTVNLNREDLQNITIFAFNKEIFIQGEIRENSVVSIYDISGRLVMSSKLDGGNYSTLGTPELGEGIYIVHLKSGSYEKVAKLILH